MEHGGSYVIKKGARKPEQVEGTKPHPDGNRARNPDGSPITRPELPAATGGDAAPASPPAASDKSKEK